MLKQRLAAEQIGLPQPLIIAGDLDSTCFRFLRARKYNVGAAVAMLKSERNQGSEDGGCAAGHLGAVLLAVLLTGGATPVCSMFLWSYPSARSTRLRS